MNLIDVNALIAEVDQVNYEYFKNEYGLLIPYYHAPSIQKLIDKQPTIDAEPVVHAHWEPLHHLDDCQKYYCRCSKCGRTVGRYHGTDIDTDCPYCHCGAKMDEETDDA